MKKDQQIAQLVGKSVFNPYTFGIKNIYSGIGDSKQLTGYRAFIEHN